MALLKKKVSEIPIVSTLAGFFAFGIAAGQNVRVQLENYIVQLGELSTNAYRGDRGKTAYDHSQVAHAPSNAEANVQVDWAQTDIGADDYIKNKPSQNATVRQVTIADNNETADNNNVVKFNSTNSFNFTLDQMVEGHRCDLINVNTGVVTLVAGNGVTINYENTNRKMDTQYTGVSLLYTSATEVVVVGKLSA